MSLYERLDQYFKLSLGHFTYKKRDASWSHVLHLLTIHKQYEKITQREADSLQVKASDYYNKRLQKLEKNIRWRRNKKSAAKQTDQATDKTAASDSEVREEYKMEDSLGE